MKYELSPLPYAYNALEPYIDEQTMRIHHDKHHQAYTDKMNAVLEKYPAFAQTPIEELLQKLPTLEIDEKDRSLLRNNGGGYANHAFFWTVMGPEKEIDEGLVEEAKKTFGTVEECKQALGEAATNHFGSGWAWLLRDEQGPLKAYSLPNQESPFTPGQ